MQRTQVKQLSAEEEWILRHAHYGQTRTPCPWCSPERKKPNDTCLSILRDFDCIKYNCHHGECGAHGLIPIRSERPVKIEAPEKKIERRRIEDFGVLQEAQKQWLASRSISLATAQKYHLIGEDIGLSPVVGFPYYDDKGNVVAVKKRWTTEKRFVCWQSPQGFFGLDKIKIGDELVIVEGEMDVLAMQEAGVNAISIPNGASTVRVDDGRIDPAEDSKFRFLWAAKDYINAAPKITLALDSDPIGKAFAEEIARRIGKERCWRAEFPDGTKDANDCLQKFGAEQLLDLVVKAPPWPIQGLYDAAHYKNKVEELYVKGVGRGESTGYDNVDELYTVVPGQVTIVTGIPSSGKSEFIDQIMVNLAESKKWKFGVCSFENEPRLHIAKLMSKRAKLPFFEGYHERMSRVEYEAAFSFVEEHFAFLHQDDGGLADLDSILSRLRVAILRYGIRGAVIDPYNFIQRDRGQMSETEWISDMLTKVKAFAMGHGIHVWFIAHPTKLQRGADGKIPPPGGYDISGSAAWFAKADCGLTVHRERDDPLRAQIHLWKVRFSWVGKQGQTDLFYNVGTTCYVEDSTPRFEPERFEL